MQSGAIERLTSNAETSESALSFSPDGQWMAFSASDDMTAYNMKNARVDLRAVATRVVRGVSSAIWTVM